MDVPPSADPTPEATAARLHATIEQAYALHSRGQDAEALGLAREGQALVSRVHLVDSLETAEVLNHLGIVFFETGYTRLAQLAYEQALAMVERLQAPDGQLAASLANNLGQAECRLGNLERAQSLLERAVELDERLLPDSMDLGFVIDNLGTVHATRGDLDAAEAMHQRALEIFERHRGPMDGHVATALGNLSGVYLRRGDFERAEAFRLRAFDAHERRSGLAAAETLLDLSHLAEISREQGDHARADHLVNLLLSIGGDSPAPTHRVLAEMLGSLATKALQDFQLDLAERLGARAAELLEAIEGPHAPETLVAIQRLGAILG